MKKINESILYSGFRKVIKREYQLPNGNIVDFEIKKEGPAVCVLAFTENGKIILAEQFRPGPNFKMLEMPGGGIDNGENPEDAAKRELLEETGYTGNFELAGTCYDDAYSTMFRHLFVAKECKKIQKAEISDRESVETILVNLKEFRELLKSGKMTDIEGGYLCLDYLELL